MIFSRFARKNPWINYYVLFSRSKTSLLSNNTCNITRGHELKLLFRRQTTSLHVLPMDRIHMKRTKTRVSVSGDDCCVKRVRSSLMKESPAFFDFSFSNIFFFLMRRNRFFVVSRRRSMKAAFLWITHFHGFRTFMLQKSKTPINLNIRKHSSSFAYNFHDAFGTMRMCDLKIRLQWDNIACVCQKLSMCLGTNQNESLLQTNKLRSLTEFIENILRRYFDIWFQFLSEVHPIKGCLRSWFQWERSPRHELETWSPFPTKLSLIAFDSISLPSQKGCHPFTWVWTWDLMCRFFHPKFLMTSQKGGCSLNWQNLDTVTELGLHGKDDMMT